MGRTTTKPRPKGTGRVRQLPSGRWQARHYDDSGKLISAPVTFDTKRDAAAWLADYSRGDIAPVERKLDATLREYVDGVEREGKPGWLAKKDLAPSTRAEYRRLLDKHILPELGDVRLSRITSEKVDDWFAKLSTGRPTQRARAYSLLRSVLIAAKKHKYLTGDHPCQVENGGRVKRKHQPRPADPLELDLIVEALPPRLRALVLIAAWCGLRFGEIAELRRADIDLTRGKIIVTRGVTFVTVPAEHVPGKRRAPTPRIVGDPKSEAGSRAVSVPPHLLPALAAHLAEHTAAHPKALLFPSATDPNRQMRHSSMDHHWEKARVVGGRPDLRFHDLRHTGATMTAATGASLKEIMARMGWSTVEAAMRYQHAANKRDEAIAEALSGYASTNVVELRRRA